LPGGIGGVDGCHFVGDALLGEAGYHGADGLAHAALLRVEAGNYVE
jgi:hypothetical protein